MAAAAQKLNDVSDAPALDAERLLLHVLGEAESSVLYAHGEKELSAQQAERLEALIARRATGEPLAYILGEWEFYGRPFFVTPDVLIPRPETENLVEAALSYLSRSSPKLGEGPLPFVIADIGTGSGCVAITLVLELSTHYSLPTTNWHIIATDISPAALAVAQKNAERHGVVDSIEFIQEDMLAFLDTPTPSRSPSDRGRKAKIDLIVSNPPYIPTAELDSPAPRGVQGKLETAGLKFEPRIALDGGIDGQKFVEQIKNAGIPALVETTDGVIVSYHLRKK